MNRVVLAGRLAADPELKYTPAGIAVTHLRIAVRDPFRKDAEGRPESDFFDVTCWRGQAEYAAHYLEKGTLIVLHGRLCVDEWIHTDGNKRRKYFVTADQIESWGKTAPGSRPPALGGEDTGAPCGAAATHPDEAGEYNDPFVDQ